MQKRYLSLDVFRGFTVALMILVNNPGSFSNIFWPLDHATWNGCTLADLVFPFFLFAVGNAAAFTLPKFKEKNPSQYFEKIGKRSVYIFLIGLFLNWFPFFKWDNDHLIFKDWHDVRILGVLQRIAICYLLAASLIFIFSSSKVSTATFLRMFSIWPPLKFILELMFFNTEVLTSGNLVFQICATVCGPGLSKRIL